MTGAVDATGWRKSLLPFVKALNAHSTGSRFKAFLLILFGSILEGVSIVLLIPLIGIVLGGDLGAGPLGRLGEGITSILFLDDRLGQMALLISFFVSLIIVRGVVLVKRDAFLTQLQADFVNTARLDLLRTLSQSSWVTISRLRHGRIVHLLGHDVHNIRAAAHFVVQILVSLVVLFTQLVLAFLLSPILTLIVIIFLGGTLLISRPLLSRARMLGSEATGINLALANDILQFLSGLKVAIGQNLQNAFIDSFQNASKTSVECEVAFARQRALSQALLVGVAAVIGGFVLVVGVAVIASPAASMVALIVVIGRMANPAMQVQQGAQQIVHSLPTFALLKQLECELAEGARARVASSERGRLVKPAPIVWESVSYHHHVGKAGAATGLQDISLVIDAGAFLGVKGQSGAGKTTFVDLLAGLYPPQSGRVSIQGRKLEGAWLEAWRESLGYVAQEPFLHNGTIRENMLWANSKASEVDVIHAIEIAGGSSLIERLPQGLDTLVGERGALLSGGERQRIALARALLRRPVLLLLDEATNAIDVSGERDLLARLSSMRNRPTIVMVAHRESSFAFCDQIIELEQGCLVRCDKGSAVA